jgi:signal peptidase I
MMYKNRVLNVLFACFVVLTFLLAGFIVFLTATHTKAFAVQTDSMYPSIKKGDVVFIRAVSPEELNEDDIITVSYNDNSGYFTHKITRIDREKSSIYTKGDNNSSEDPVPAEFWQITGRVWFVVPFIGNLSLAVQSRILLISLAATAIMLALARTVISSRKIKKDGGGKDAEK